MNDAARALGYVHASERLFQMEMQRRAGQGRLSEVIGSSTVGIDKFIRTLDLYRLAESSAKALSPDAQSLLAAYAGGVNAWIDTHHHSLPPEFVLMDMKPEPWKPADSVVWGKLMALQLSHNDKLEVLRAQLAKKLSPEQMKAMFPPYGDAPVTLAAENHAEDGQQLNSANNAHLSRMMEACGQNVARLAIAKLNNQLGRITPPSIMRHPTNGSYRGDHAPPAANRFSPTIRIWAWMRRSCGISRASSRRRAGSRARPCPACRSCCSARPITSPGA